MNFKFQFHRLIRLINRKGSFFKKNILSNTFYKYMHILIHISKIHETLWCLGII
jgi:hypothetical protein